MYMYMHMYMYMYMYNIHDFVRTCSKLKRVAL